MQQRRNGAFVAFACIALPLAVSAETVFVSRPGLRCVIENAPAYLALTQDPVLVFLEICPIVAPSNEDLAKLVQNSLPVPRTAEAGAKSTNVLPLRKAELRCLVDRQNDLLRDEPDAPLVALSMPICR